MPRKKGLALIMTKSHYTFGASLVALALLSSAAPSEARVAYKRHVSHRAVTQNSDAAEIAELKAQVNGLTARLEAQEAAQRITADQAAVAANQTASLQKQIASNNAAVSGQIKSAINANTPKDSGTTITSTLFFNASNINQKTNGVRVSPSGTGFDLKRAYLGVSHKFDKHFSATLLIDANANSSAYNKNATPLNGQYIYVKNAFLEYKLNDAFIVRAGAAPSPWLPYAESVYGNRFVENTFIDRDKLGNTTDWGLHVLGTIGNPKSLNITYAASALNGGGYKNPTRTNTVDLEGRVSANYKGFTAGVGGYTGKLAADPQNVVLTGGLTAPRTATRFDALVGYVGPRFRVSAEYIWAKNFSQNIITGVNKDDVAEGYSVSGAFNVTPKWSVFGRYDTIKPNKYTASNLKDDYFNTGITYSAVKGVDLSLVYKREVLNGSTNGLIAGSTDFTSQDTKLTTTSLGGVAKHGTFDEIGLYGQIKF